ncbi:MAG: hypothetical protein Q8J97_14415, partial [Flavobacteriaceae bacterium]|nr:hypothetical protein [Flavobacteriaceae bacterium]
DLAKQHKVLEVQVKRVNDDLRQSKYDVVKLDEQKKRVTEELLELTLENESCNIELQRMTKIKEEELVNADVLKLQVERLKKLLLRRDDELLGLENRRQQLDLTVTEREAEIAVHHDVLRMEAKTTEEERRQIAGELKERQRQVEHLKSRYQVLIGRMDKEQGEMTHAQHIVRTAKEREELQATGDAIDSEIKRVERETRKLDKLISTLKGSNAKFKHQFNKVSEDDDEIVQQKLLQQKNKELQAIINRRTTEMKEYLRSEMSKMTELQDAQREAGELRAKAEMLEGSRTALTKDIDEQKELVARYDVAVEKAKRTTEPEIAADIAVQEEREQLEAIIAMLVNAGYSKGEELGRVLEGALTRASIPIPAGVGAHDDEFPPGAGDEH